MDVEVPRSITREMERIRKAHLADAIRMVDRPDVEEIRVIGLPPPPPIERFYGRAKEQQILAKFLVEPSLSIISVVGEGGTGKTALVRKLLHELEIGHWPLPEIPVVYGIVYLSTRTAGISLDRLYSECAQLLSGDDEQALMTLWSQPKIGLPHKINRLLDKLRGKTVLVMLDNFEDHLDENGRVADPDLAIFFDVIRDNLTRHQLRIVITTRIEPRWRRGKYDDFEAISFGGLDQREAFDLLHTFMLSNAEGLLALDPARLDTFVRQVQGSPRALELLAGIYASKPEQDIDSLLAILTDAQQPAEALARYYHDNLTENERTVMRALAVYNRPVPLVALQFMLLQIAPQLNVPDIIQQLRASYAITYETPSIYGIKLNMTSLHTIDRDVALQRLDKPEVWHLQAAEYYARMHLDMKWSHIRHLEPHLLELDHRLLAHDYERALALLNSIDYSPGSQHKYLASLLALGYGEFATEQRARLRDHLATPQAEAENLAAMAWVYRRMSKIAEAQQAFAGACQLADESGDDSARWFAHSEYGYLLTDNIGRHDDARQELETALFIADRRQDPYMQAHCHLGLAFVAFQQGENQRAVDEAKTALSGFQKVNSVLARYREVDCWIRLNLIARKMQQYDLANEYVEAGIKVAEAAQFVDWVAELNAGLGFNERGRGYLNLAIDYHHKALAAFSKERGMKREEAVQHSYLGNLYLDMGQLVPAHDAFDEALRIVDNIGIVRERSWILGNRGILEARRGNLEAALKLQDEAISIAKDNKLFDSLVTRYTDRAATYLLLRNFAAAQADILHALQNALYHENREAQHGAQLPDAYINAKIWEDKLSHEMQSPGDDQRRGVILARTYLHTGDLANALSVIQRARQADVILHRHTTAVLRGLILARMGDATAARENCAQAVAFADEVIARTPEFYLAHYSRGLAHTLLAILDDSEQALNRAKQAYQQAQQLCRADGVTADTHYLLQEVIPLDGKAALIVDAIIALD